MTAVYVVDASAMAQALIGRSEGSADLRRRLQAAVCHAPHLIDAEVGSVLRRHELSGQISPQEARLGLAACAVLVDHRHPHAGDLAELAWTWRQNLTFYDALYVALAVRLDAPLLTADQRLTRAPDTGCRLEIV